MGEMLDLQMNIIETVQGWQCCDGSLHGNDGTDDFVLGLTSADEENPGRGFGGCKRKELK